jgi:two-component system chemotaxis response regulator CheY
MKFMVVDDSQIIRTQIERVLKEDNFEFLGSAEDGQQAIDEFKQMRPKLVTMDLTMPRVDGLQAIREMVAIDSDVRILVVSALKDMDTALEALSLGAHGFLCKPFTDYELITAIEELLSDL